MAGSAHTTPTILGVAGGSGSGKTTVAQTLLERVGLDRIAFLVQDSYYRDVDWPTDPAERAEAIRHYNFDHPSALDTDLLVEHLTELRAGRAVEVPVYDFERHRRAGRTVAVAPSPVILLEGILLFVEPSVRALLDFKIFVDTDADVRLLRRLRRDISERGRTLDSVLDQYMETVRPMHLEFIEPSKRHADVIVPEGGENAVAMDMVTTHVEHLLGRSMPPMAD